MEVYSSLKNLT